VGSGQNKVGRGQINVGSGGQVISVGFGQMIDGQAGVMSVGFGSGGQSTGSFVGHTGVMSVWPPQLMGVNVAWASAPAAGAAAAAAWPQTGVQSVAKVILQFTGVNVACGSTAAGAAAAA
jgi:hypothetical protein